MKLTMRRLMQMILFQFRSLYRNKIAFIFNLIFPLLMVATFGVLFGIPRTADTTEPIGWVDQDGGVVSREMLTRVESMGRYELTVGDESELIEAMQQGDVRTVVVIPSGFGDDLETMGGPATVRVLYDPMSPRSSQVMVEVRQLLASLDAVMQGAHLRLHVATEVYADEARFDAFDYLMPGQMAVMVLSAGLVTVSMTMASQRSRGAMRHLFSTPLSIGTWALSRIVANAVMAVLQCTILFGFARLTFGVGAPANLLGTGIAVMMSMLVSLGMGILIGTFVKREEATMAVAMPLFMLMLFLGDAAMPLQDPPAFISALLPYVPSYHMTQAMRAVMMQGAGVASILPELAILGGIAVVLFSVSLVRLRRQYVIV